MDDFTFLPSYEIKFIKDNESVRTRFHELGLIDEKYSNKFNITELSKYMMFVLQIRSRSYQTSGNGIHVPFMNCKHE